MSVDLSVRTGDQASFRMSRQMAPYASASCLRLGVKGRAYTSRRDIGVFCQQHPIYGL